MEEPTARTSPFRSPALAPAAALIVGLRLGLAAPGLTPGSSGGLPWQALLALVLLGFAWGRRAGTLLGVCALGAVAGAVAAGQGLAPSESWVPDPDRPVVAVAEVTGHWLTFEDSWSAPVRVVRLRQGAGRNLRVRSQPLQAQLRVAGPEDPPPVGSRLRVRGHLRRAPPLGNRPATAPGPWRLSCKSRRLLEEVAPPGPLARAAGALRTRVERALAATQGGTQGLTQGSIQEKGGAPGVSGAARPIPSKRALALVRALVLGDASRVSLPVRQGLRRLGLAHVLAVSGLHVALVVGVAAAAGSWLGRRARFAVSLGATASYLLVVGPRPALLRASVMGCLAVASLVAERPPQAANAMAVAAAVLALLRPALLLDLGFRLTVGATAGIVLLGPTLARAWDGRRNGGGEGSAEVPGSGPVASGSVRHWLRRTLAASVGAQLGVLPWALPSFCLLTPWAPVANLVAVPWTALSLSVCLLWTGVACVSPTVARGCVGAVDLVAAPFSWVAALPPRPWVAVPLSAGPLTAGLLAWGLAVALCRLTVRRALALVAGVGGAGLLVSGMSFGSGQAPVAAVAIDVGQGDAILIRDGRAAALVDGGGWRYGDLGGRVLLPVLARLGVRRLDAVVATHPDRDHCGGLVDVAGYLAVGEAITGPGVEATSCGRALRGLPGVRHRTVAAGGEIAVGRWRLHVLHPTEERARGGDNDDSLVITAEAFGRRLLLTGDIEARGERQLLRRARSDLRCDLLKVAHHGSRSSSGDRFLEEARPRLAVVSVGARNPYGHPASEVLDRLRRRGVATFRTDRDGMVAVEIRPNGSMRVALPAAPKGGRQ